MGKALNEMKWEFQLIPHKARNMAGSNGWINSVTNTLNVK